MPNALLEAMAIGKPCVATDVNGASELIEDGISGLLVQSENVTQIYEQLNKLLSDESLRISIEEKALERVRSHFTMKKMVDQLEAMLFEKLIKPTIKINVSSSNKA